MSSADAVKLTMNVQNRLSSVSLICRPNLNFSKHNGIIFGKSYWETTLRDFFGRVVTGTGNCFPAKRSDAAEFRQPRTCIPAQHGILIITPCGAAYWKCGDNSLAVSDAAPVVRLRCDRVQCTRLNVPSCAYVGD